MPAVRRRREHQRGRTVRWRHTRHRRSIPRAHRSPLSPRSPGVVGPVDPPRAPITRLGGRTAAPPAWEPRPARYGPPPDGVLLRQVAEPPATASPRAPRGAAPGHSGRLDAPHGLPATP